VIWQRLSQITEKNNFQPMARKQTLATEGFNEILLYTTPNGKVKVEIYLQNETIWLTQQKIADLFGIERSVVTKHLKNIYKEGELMKEATCAKIAQVQIEGVREVTRSIEFYNLDAIISVGYRVNSTQATHFKVWATGILTTFPLFPNPVQKFIGPHNQIIPDNCRRGFDRSFQLIFSNRLKTQSRFNDIGFSLQAK
jgi:hypothetical protein